MLNNFGVVAQNLVQIPCNVNLGNRRISIRSDLVHYINHKINFKCECYIITGVQI